MSLMQSAFAAALDAAKCVPPKPKTRRKLTCDIWEVYSGIRTLSKFDKIKATDGLEYQVKDLGVFTVIVWDGDGSKVVTPTHKRKLRRHWEVFVEGTYIYNGKYYFKRVKNGCVEVGVCPEGFVEAEGTVLRTYVEGWPCEVEEVPIEETPASVKMLSFAKWVPAYEEVAGEKVARFEKGDLVRRMYSSHVYRVAGKDENFVVGMHLESGQYLVIEPHLVQVLKRPVDAHQAGTYFTDGEGRYWIKKPIAGARYVKVDSEGIVIEESKDTVYDYPREAYICDVEEVEP